MFILYIRSKYKSFQKKVINWQNLHKQYLYALKATRNKYKQAEI